MPYKISFRQTCGVFLCLFLLASCASTPPEPKPAAPLVFPPPPAEPRFIFERTLRYSSNVETEESAFDKFKRFAVGSPQTLKGIIKPYDIATKYNKVYITDTIQSRVLVFDINGGKYFEFGHEGPGTLGKPTGIDISAQDEIFISDVSNKAVMIYSLEGQYLRSIGGSKMLNKPSDVVVDSNHDRLYVVDTGGVDNQEHGVHVFTLTTGQYVNRIGKRGSQPGEFNLPLQADVAADGTLYVVDSGNFRVQAFDAQGNYLRSIGTLGRYPGQFARPKGITTDNDGNIYVVDTAFGNFQIFNSKGELLLFIGERSQSSKPAAYMLPAGIDVDETGRIYIADQFFRKVDIYRPAKLVDHSASE